MRNILDNILDISSRYTILKLQFCYTSTDVVRYEKSRVIIFFFASCSNIYTLTHTRTHALSLCLSLTHTRTHAPVEKLLLHSFGRLGCDHPALEGAANDRCPKREACIALQRLCGVCVYCTMMCYMTYLHNTKAVIASRQLLRERLA
jgi:hypothetical protein